MTINKYCFRLEVILIFTKDSFNNKILRVILICTSSLYGSLYLELFYESYNDTSRLYDFVSLATLNGAFMRFMGMFILFIVICVLVDRIFERFKILPQIIFRYRFLIGFIILSVLVMLEISGSSVASFADVFEYDGNTDTIFGHARSIRSDEYNVFTPMCISQVFNNFDIYNGFLTSYPENVSMTYGSPTLSLITLFRPSLWGFILFGASKGLAFFWNFRFLMIFFATFEFARILTQDNRTLSFACAVLVTFSPMIQWWYGTAFTLEIISVGELLCVSLHHLLSFRKSSFIFAILIPWLCGNYLFALYPAWQVPCFYVFAILGILFAVDRYKLSLSNSVLVNKRKVLLTLLLSLVVFSIFIAVSLIQGYDVIVATSRSAYPGARSEQGGKLLEVLSEKGASSLLPINKDIGLNQCETAGFFDFSFFSIVFGILLSIKSRDKYLISLLFLFLFFFLYGVIGFPEYIAKITLLSNTPSYRLEYVLGFISILILLRSLSFLRSIEFSFFDKLVVFVAIVINAIFLFTVSSWVGIGGYTLIILEVLLVLLVFLISIKKTSSLRNSISSNILFSVIFLCLIPGLCINPVQKGIRFLENIPEVKIMNSLDKHRSVVASNIRCLTRMSSYAGVKSLGVQVYPIYSLWETIDPSHISEDVWNRYAHICVFIKAQGDPEFILTAPDSLNVYLSIKDLKKMGVNYFATDNLLKDQVEILDAQATKVGETEMCSFYSL